MSPQVTYQLSKISTGGNKTPLRKVSAKSLAEAESHIPPNQRGKFVVELVAKDKVGGRKRG